MDWTSLAQPRRDHLAGTIRAVDPPVPDVPPNLPLNVSHLPQQLLEKPVRFITELPPESLLADLAAGKISSTEVTKAFLQRAGLASKLTNCITELLPDRALQRAEWLDRYLQETGEPVGPLHGLPISVKELIGMEGLDLNAAFVSWIGFTAPVDALILKLLWNAGAVFHARTTQPQSLMHLETSNNIYGVTVNPYNRNLTSGGSSGGEGALLGLRGSCLGIGTDIEGSIRSPAGNNGLFGHRPSSYRLPLGGLLAPMLGSEQIVPVIGPLSTSLDGIQLFMKTIIDQQPWLYEPSLLPIAWKDTKQQSLLRKGEHGERKLRIGLMVDDGVVRPHPPVLRAINTVIGKLEHHPDIEIIDFPPYKHDEAWQIISSLYFGDGGREETEAIDASGEPWRPLTNFIVKENPNVKSLALSEVWTLTVEREAYRSAYTRHWNSINTELPGPDSGADVTVGARDVQDQMVDVILCPVGPGCAPPFDCARYWGYTSQWNLLDYPALVFPTGLVCGPEDQLAEYQPRNEQDAYNQSLYNPETYKDAPISLQLVGRRYEDEKLIEALEFILEVAKIPKTARIM